MNLSTDSRLLVFSRFFPAAQSLRSPFRFLVSVESFRFLELFISFFLVLFSGVRVVLPLVQRSSEVGNNSFFLKRGLSIVFLHANYSNKLLDPCVQATCSISLDNSSNVRVEAFSRFVSAVQYDIYSTSIKIVDGP